MRIELLFSEFYPGTFIVDIESESEREHNNKMYRKGKKTKKNNRLFGYQNSHPN